MVLHASEITHSGEKHPLILELGNLVNPNKNPGIDGILEVTYGYDRFGGNSRYNKSLFEEYAGIKRLKSGKFVRKLGPNEIIQQDSVSNTSENREVSFEDLKSQFITKANYDINKFKAILAKVQQTSVEEFSEYGIGKKEKKVLIKTIEHSMLLLELTLNGLDFELEKAGFEHGLNEDEIKAKIARNEEIETEVFGGNIIENKQEAFLCFGYLENSIQKYKKLSEDVKSTRVKNKQVQRVLDKTELKRLDGYTKRIKDKIEEKHGEISLGEYENSINPTGELFKKLEHIRIPRDKVLGYCKGALSLQGMRQSVELTDKSSPYDGPNKLEIPNSEEFETMDFKRVQGFIMHEILAHYINQANHEASPYGDVRLAGNITKEEGLATKGEKKVKGEDIEGINAITPTFLMTLAGEIFNREELKDFTDLHSQVEQYKGVLDTSLDRRKRNYPDDYIGVQHKDVTYVRGLIETVNFLKSGGQVEDLFVGKIGLAEIKDGDFKFKENEMLFPILSVEILQFYIMNAYDNKHAFSHSDFMKYMREKYGDIISEQSFEKLANTKLGIKTFKGALKVIAPILQEIQEQTANDDISPEIKKNLLNISNRVQCIVNGEVRLAS